MRAQSLWTDLQSIPVALFYLQGDIAERSVQQIRSSRWILGFGAGLARSKRDSRPTQRISAVFKERQKETFWWGERRNRSQGSEATIILASRNR